LKEFNENRYKVHKLLPPTAIVHNFKKQDYIIDINCIPNYCFNAFPIRSKNTILIYKDSIIKPKSTVFLRERYPLDSLYFLYKKDVLNYKKRTNYSDAPEELVLCVQLSESEPIASSQKILDVIIGSYLKITKETKDSLPLNISFDFRLPPPPPSLTAE